MNKYLWLGLLLLIFSVKTMASKWVISRPDIPTKPGTLIIKGSNNTNNPALLLIRIDDSFSPKYPNRVNLERMIPTGKFSLEVDLVTLLKSNKTPLNIHAIKQIIIFNLNGKDTFHINSTDFVKHSSHDFAGIAWDFGGENSKIWPGFTQITPMSNFLTGNRLNAVVREQHFGINEGLITDGIKGIDKVKLPVGKGTWTLTLFIDDMGDWEYTPRVLSQTFLINDMVIKDTQRTHDDWVNDHYLKGKSLGYKQKVDVFNHYIDILYRPLTLTFTTDKDENYLFLNGDTADSQYLSALIIEPGDKTDLLTHTQKRRKQWWKQNWPIQNKQNLYTEDILLNTKFPKQFSLARGSQYFYFLTIPHTLEGKIGIASITDVSNKNRLIPTLRQAQWQLGRTELKSNLLSPRADNFIAPHSAIHSQTLPIRYLLHIKVPETTKAGTYNLAITLSIDNQEYSFPIEVNVLDTFLPPLEKAIGVYLETPYQHTFSGHAEAQKAASCDVDYLSSLGLNSIAPSLSTPTTIENEIRFFRELDALQEIGLTQPIMAYTPFKRMRRELGLEQTIINLNHINEKLIKQGYPTVYFSVLDEPSNADADKLRAALGQHSFKTAGHYNHKKDQSWFTQTDLNLINAGVSLSHKFIKPWVANGRRFWLYNIEDHYSAASLLSWFLPVEGYLQWHARLPTGLPYVPFDGREDDVQFLYAQSQICPSFYHISGALGALSNGITDHRWLLWLDKKALSQPRAQEIKQNIHKYINSHLDKGTPFKNFDFLTQIKALVSPRQE